MFYATGRFPSSMKINRKSIKLALADVVRAARFAILDKDDAHSWFAGQSRPMEEGGEGGGGGRKSMTVNWGAHVLILDLKFQVCEIIWGLKFRIPKCAFWGLEIQSS